MHYAQYVVIHLHLADIITHTHYRHHVSHRHFFVGPIVETNRRQRRNLTRPTYEDDPIANKKLDKGKRVSRETHAEVDIGESKSSGGRRENAGAEDAGEISGIREAERDL